MMHHSPNILTAIAELIAQPSISSGDPALDQSNVGVIDLLATWLDDLGFRVEIQPVFDGAPPNGEDPLPMHAARHRVAAARKANLIATLGTGNNGLVLAGHTDTVPFDEGRWSRDPFGGRVANDRIYGLGTSDMKAFLALAVEAARGLRAEELTAPLIILATADEETSMSGARALLEAPSLPARYAVVGEPTGLRPARQHKGIMMDRIRLTGRSGHSSNPAFGNNAIEGMHVVIGELMALRAEFEKRHRNGAFLVDYPTLNLGHIHGGDNPNRICGQCELHIDVRPLPGMRIEDIRAEIDQRIRARLANRGFSLEIEELFPGVPAVETPADARIVRAAEALSGATAEAVAFATEAPFLREMGMEVVVLGPGDIDQAHQPDEFLALDRITPTVSLLRGLIERFCRQPLDRPTPLPQQAPG